MKNKKDVIERVKVERIVKMLDKEGLSAVMWLSVKDDGLPGPKQKVLTYSPNLEDPYRILETNNGKFFSAVTHWMYLPLGPSSR